jgi:transcriptional regulator GlxA family with amidase domain
MDHRVDRVIERMERDLNKPLQLETLAQLVNLSSSRLRHAFRAQTGESPGQYLKRLRMGRAKDLLETTFLTVKEIMYSVGIRDESHFVREFEKAYGMSPTRYRARGAKPVRTPRRVTSAESANK